MWYVDSKKAKSVNTSVMLQSESDQVFLQLFILGVL